MPEKKLLSIIIPVYNEESNLPPLYEKLKELTNGLSYEFEFLFVDDGSKDSSTDILQKFSELDPRVKIIPFSRNFGKEIATTAGLNMCKGDAAIMLDADMQYPVELIPHFIEKWQSGSDVVVGVRKNNAGEGMMKKIGSILFYKILNSIAETKVTPNSTDYRLLDREVIDEFNRFTERNRITRGLIDWLGYPQDYIYFDAQERQNGKARYSVTKLIRLALNSFVSLSLFPLKIAGYLGIVITCVSGALGLFILIEKYLLKDPLGLHFTSPAILTVILLFLIGIVLVCMGLMALYIANIHGEVINRPLYIIRSNKYENSMDVVERS